MTTHLHLVRLTLEAESPLSLGSGAEVTRRRNDPAGDGSPKDHLAAALIRDANELPTIPGPSLQGVLRRLARAEYSKNWADGVFGTEGTSHADGTVGTVICGWGLVHGADDVAVDPRPRFLAPGSDSVLDLLRQEAPVWRDHVALSHRLSVEGRKKFARAAVPRGTRFSVELARFGAKGDRVLIEVAALLRHPDFRLGAARNSGYGRLKLREASHAALPLTDPDTIRRRRNEPPSSALPHDLLVDKTFPQSKGTATVARIALKAEGLLRFGAATEEAVAFTCNTRGARKVAENTAPNLWTWADDPRDAQKENVLRLLAEPVIRWTKAERGEVLTPQTAGDVAVGNSAADKGLAALGSPVPGSQLRGPLAHRALFHWNRAQERTVDAEAYAGAIRDQDDKEKQRLLADLESKTARPPELVALFGAGKGPPAAGRGHSPGQAARLMVDDARVEADWIVALDHISIDRFTGGVRNIEGVLFAEEALLGASIAAEVRIERGGTDGVGGWSVDVADALLRALRDLCAGRLPLGARSLGACTGTISWSGADAAAWEERARVVGARLAASGGKP